MAGEIVVNSNCDPFSILADFNSVKAFRIYLSGYEKTFN